MEKLCALVLDTERLALFGHELRNRQAKLNGQPLPKIAGLLLSKDEQKRIRQIAHDDRLAAATAQLYTGLGALCETDADTVFALPPPFPSLDPSDGQKIRQLFLAENRLAFVSALVARQGALLAGRPAPSHPNMNLPADEQKEIGELLRGTRVYLCLLHQSVAASK